MTKKTVLLVFVGVLTMMPGCGTQSRQNAQSAAPSTVQVASPQPIAAPHQTADASAPSQAQTAPEPERSADNPDLDGVRVDVVDQGTVLNDWSQSVIRVIKAKRESGDDIYFYCDTILQGPNNRPVVINGKPWQNLACFAPRLRAIYTLHDTGGRDGWYWMYPPGVSDADEADGKRIMVRYCPKCAPDGDSQ
jgi:hypothetical protein